MELTATEKRVATMKRKRETAERARAEQKAERELIKKSLLAVLNSEEATPAEKLESSKLLLEMSHRPY